MTRTTFKVKRSKVKFTGRGHIVAASRTACYYYCKFPALFPTYTRKMPQFVTWSVVTDFSFERSGDEDVVNDASRSRRRHRVYAAAGLRPPPTGHPDRSQVELCRRYLKRCSTCRAAFWIFVGRRATSGSLRENEVLGGVQEAEHKFSGLLGQGGPWKQRSVGEGP